MVDVSASTDSWIRGDRRVIDVEKEALLVVCEALDALGDDYAVTTFSGRGPEAVRVRSVKQFDEEYDESIRRRIGRLAPDRYTRCGAALRHATTRVRARGVRHPVVLMLSDGKPNDADLYETQYGIEDTRQAVHEAHMQGVEVFCLTIDREAPTYMDQIFGPDAYAVLHQPDRLPQVLVQLVRRLLDR
ncbi:MAG: nitric oxide reductase activation protein NorD [Bradymonadaceae bacterium]